MANNPDPFSFHDRFLFRGNATGIAGHLRRDGAEPRDVLFSAVGSVALPITGGKASESVEAFELIDDVNNERLFRVGRVDVEVRGDYEPPAAVIPFTRNQTHGRNLLPTLTTVTTRIEDLQVLFNSVKPNTPAVSVGAIDVRWESRHTRGDEPDIALSVAVEDLRINGDPVAVRQADELLAETTYDGLKKTYKGNNAFRARRAKHFNADPAKPNMPHGRGRPDKSEITMCRIFEDLAGQPEPPVSFHDGYIVKIDGFGIIYLGEMVISPADRRLTVMRMEVGSPRGGDLNVGGSGTNGTTWPP